LIGALGAGLLARNRKKQTKMQRKQQELLDQLLEGDREVLADSTPISSILATRISRSDM